MAKQNSTPESPKMDSQKIEAATKRTLLLQQLDKQKKYGPLSPELEELEKELIKENHDFIDYICDFFSIPKIDWGE